MIYELRTYQLAVGGMADYLDLIRTKLLPYLTHQGQRQITVDAPFVELVKNYCCRALQKWIVLQATQDIRKVSLWLGHATLTTTEIYPRGDPTEKLDAMESIIPPHLRRGAFQPSDKLIELLRRSS